jgi:hypothetical protein
MKQLLFVGMVISNSVAAQLLPPFETVMAPNKVGWAVIRDQSVGVAGMPPGTGTGSFLSFQSQNAAGKWGDWALINGGLVSKNPGFEQGDLDFVTVVDGKTSGFAFQGKYQGQQPSLLPIVPSQPDIGRQTSKWNNLHLAGTIYLPTATCPATVVGLAGKICIKLIVDGKEVFFPGYLK